MKTFSISHCRLIFLPPSLVHKIPPFPSRIQFIRDRHCLQNPPFILKDLTMAGTYDKRREEHSQHTTALGFQGIAMQAWR